MQKFGVLKMYDILFFQLFDTYSLEQKKTYKTERPVNSAALSPTEPHVSDMYKI